MDSSASSPDADNSVYSSPEFSGEPCKEGKVKTSVSVSSLAEKFEKSTDSTKSEDKPVTDQELSENEANNNQAASDVKSDAPETNVIAPQSSTKLKIDNNSCIRGENEILQGASHVLETANGILTDETAGSKNTNKYLVSNSRNDLSYRENHVREDCKIDSCVLQPSTSSVDVNGEKIVQPISYASSERPIEQQISKAVEERVAFFAEKISKSSQTSLKDDATSSGRRSRKSSFSDVASQISLKDLEQSFVAALNIVNSNSAETEKPEDTLPVPSIQITEASDREDSGSEETEETKVKSKETKVEAPIVKKTETSNASETNVESTPSTSATSELEKRESVSAEERKAFFYISSSDLPATSVKESTEISDELRQRPVTQVNQDSREETVLQQQGPRTRNQSCLCSKTTHGIIFLVSFVVAILGFILYNLAHEGKAPDFCQHLGLVTAIIAGIIGAFSCFCFTCLEAFPRIEFTGYERIRDAENLLPGNVNKKSDAQALEEESWSSEKERAFRRQNGMSSTRTSTGSLKRIPTDHKELLEKTEKLKKEVVTLLDSFSGMLTKLQPGNDVADMESGIVNGPP